MPEVFKAPSVSQEHEEVKKILDKASRGQFGSFVACPERMKFESQQDDEQVLILGRRHIITNLRWIAIISFAIFIPFFWGEFPFIKVLNGNTSVSLVILWYMGLAFFGLQSFLLWFYNVYIVTNERLVDVDFMGMLNKTVNVAQLDRIEDVNYSQRGVLAGFFNYGDVIVETASEQRMPNSFGEPSAFTFENISDPDKVATVISELSDEHHK